MNLVPVCEPTGQLYETCPQADNSRYHSTKRSQLTSLVLNIGFHASPTYLPPHWSAHVQPEGKPYFSHQGQMTTVTESWVYSAETVSEIEKWIECITVQVKEKKTDLINLELYIRLDEDMDCFYYIVDRQTQTLFWIKEDLTTEDVGLEPVVSPSHLRTALEKEFWQHIDRFPAHFGGLPEESLLKLLDAFSHIRIDQITSSYSTFTHPPVQTQAIYDVLERCRGRTHEPAVISSMARGWNAVLFSRFHNLYGEETPRIDSRRSVYDELEMFKEIDGYGRRIIGFLTFGQSEIFREKLDALSVDQLVCSYRVSDFVQERVLEWKEQVVPSFLMLSLHVSFFFSHTSQVAVTASATCCSISLVSALALIQQHKRLSHDNNPDEVVNWFHSRLLGKYKLQGVASIFAAPSASFNWGIISFFGHWLFIALSQVHSTIAVPLIGAIGVACFLYFLRVLTATGTVDATPTLASPEAALPEHESARSVEDMV